MHDTPAINSCCNLNVELPFFFAMHKETFKTVGGYDTDLAEGIAYDDNAFQKRLLDYGCYYKKFFKQNEVMIIHLFHDRKNKYENGGYERWKINKRKYEEKYNNGRTT